MRQLLRFPLLPIALLLALAGKDQLAAQDVLIRDATVYTMAGQGILEGGDVLIRQGKIVEVGTSVSAPQGIPVIAGEGWHVLPGLIDAHSHIATQDERGGGSDRHERGQRDGRVAGRGGATDPRLGLDTLRDSTGDAGSKGVGLGSVLGGAGLRSSLVCSGDRPPVSENAPADPSLPPPNRGGKGGAHRRWSGG